ncbi:vWA domain-containing protein [Salibacterium aidingense]|uniref:vWA domain-containing protein n=1 Tax=Salibacterium aidingense TaxID=384933 RepID=UPI000403FE13|nr:VWA domain-containing protein [Salibacterium aidingense]
MSKYRLYKHQTVINSDRYDRRQFLSLFEKSKNLQKMVEQNKDEPHYFPLLSDIYSAFYKVKLVLKEDVPAAFQMNQSILRKMMDTRDYQKYHQLNQGDSFACGLATITYSEKIEEWVETRKEENKALQDKLQVAKEKAEEAEVQADMAKQLEQDGYYENSQEAQFKAEQLQQEEEEAQKEAATIIENDLHTDPGKELESALAQQSQMAADHTKKVNQLIGGTGVADHKKVPLDEKFQLAEAVRSSVNFRDIADWAGTFRKIAKEKHKKKTHDSVERNGVTVGSDVERLLPQELAYFSKTSTKKDFLRRYAEQETMMLQQEGKENMGKGPVILCLDQSGSMTHMDTMAKGFTLAMMMVAKKEKRDFALIPFSTTAYTRTFFRGKMTSQQFKDMASDFLNGGTQYHPPFQEVEKLLKGKKEWKKADILFVTDGAPSDMKKEHDYQSVWKMRKDYSCNVMSVLIGERVSDQHVRPFSDSVVHAADFMDEEVLNKAFSI